MRAAPSSALRAGSIMGTAVVLAMTVAVAMSTGSTTPEATDDPVGGLELVAFSLPSPSDHSTVNTSVVTAAAELVTMSTDSPVAHPTKASGNLAMPYKRSSASAPPAGLARVARAVSGNTLEVELALLKAPPLAAAAAGVLPPSPPASPNPPGSHGQPEYATGADISPPAVPPLRVGTRDSSAGGGGGSTSAPEDGEDDDGDDDDGEDEVDEDEEDDDDGNDEDDDEDGDGEEEEVMEYTKKASLPSPAPAPSPERKRHPPVAEDQLPAADEVTAADERLLELMVRIAENPENWRHVHSELQTLDQDLSRVRQLEAAAHAASEPAREVPSSSGVAEEILWVPEPQKKASAPRGLLVDNRWEEEEEEEGQKNFISPAAVEGVARGAKNRGKGGRPRKKPRRPHATPPSEPEDLPLPDDDEDARRRQLFAAGVLIPAEEVGTAPAHASDGGGGGGGGKGRGRGKADSKEKNKSKEKPKDKQRARAKEKEREKELQRERLREKEREKERQRERDREKDRQREREREKERMREREEREREREMEAMELEREREQREREIQRLKDGERERERERARQKEREREFRLERERERELSAWGKIREKDNRVRPDVENNIHTPDRTERVAGSKAVSFQSAGPGLSQKESKSLHKSGGLNDIHSALAPASNDWVLRGSFDELKQGHLASGSRAGAEEWPRLPPPEPAVTRDDAGRWPDFSALASLRHRHHRPRHRQGSALEAALAKHREILANTWTQQRPKQADAGGGKQEGGRDPAQPPQQRPPAQHLPPPLPPPPAPQKPEDAAPAAAPASPLGSPGASRPWPHFAYHRVTTSPQLLAEAAARPRNAYVAVSLVPSPAEGGTGSAARGHRPPQPPPSPPAVADGANGSRDGADEALQPLSVRSSPSDPLEKQLAQAAAAAAAAAGSRRENGAGGDSHGGGSDVGGGRGSTLPWSHARHLDRMQEQLRTLSAVEERLRYRWLERERLRQMLRDGGAPGGAGSLLRAPRGGSPVTRSSSSPAATAAP